MDDDKDGVIQVDHVMKVIELLGTTHAKLPAKQIRQIVDMLAKEEMLEMEDNIEEDMDKALRGKYLIFSVIFVDDFSAFRSKYLPKF